MKRGTIEHAKMHHLAERLKLPRYAAVGIMESLWHMAATKAPTGDISAIPATDIAFYVGWERDPQELIEALVACRWLDRNGDGLLIHDWADHAEDSVKRWLSRHGLSFTCPDKSGHVAPAVAVASASAVALPETTSSPTKASVGMEGETVEQTKKQPTTPTGMEFEAFWRTYPRKVGKLAAFKAWKARKHDRPPLADILAAVEAAKRSSQWSKDGGQFIPHPSTWLNKGQWADEPTKGTAPAPAPATLDSPTGRWMRLPLAERKRRMAEARARDPTAPVPVVLDAAIKAFEQEREK